MFRLSPVSISDFQCLLSGITRLLFIKHSIYNIHCISIIVNDFVKKCTMFCHWYVHNSSVQKKKLPSHLERNFFFTVSILLFLPKSNIQRHHHRKSHCKKDRSKVGMFPLGHFRNQFLHNHIYHRTGCKA